MEQKKVDIFRRIKRIVQTKIILKYRDKIYNKQTEEQFKYILEYINKSHNLFITHDNDGGTRAFEQFVLNKYANLIVLRRLRHEFMEDEYFSLEIISDNDVLFYLIKKDELEKVFDNKYKLIILNSLVTYRNCEKILEVLRVYKISNPECRIEYYVHDYHAVCPNKHLLINNFYCYLECKKFKCNLCMGDEEVNIQKWRRIWNDFFKIVNIIVCFSDSSKEIIKKAYPLVEDEKIRVQPHDVSYCMSSPISEIDKLPLCIGIVGAVHTAEKGKPIVCQIIKHYGNNVPIRIIGTKAWRIGTWGRKVKYIGPYKRDELRTILIEQKISLVVFPSLCPETFSFLISELMAVKIPIICFNFGAQAEKVKQYDQGIVCDTLEDMYRIIDKKMIGVIN